MTTSPAASAPIDSRPSHRLRRTLAAVCAGAGVAVVGVSAMPGTAQAAGVATGYRYLPTSSAATGSSLSPTSLPVHNLESSAVLRYTVAADGSLRSI
ncbi:hypothetical protein [Allobranchiibius sp. CTAmp26]|uniref:hypothetical protein n=1 Tax=Allobranchiibius sp. CTAmp26 TaxID=2815214 RepID=UPI001AA0F5BE|nr:hypothetical protein [Allobranchiibius sp. CTAmp26]MBO1754006.1 hypothetical protein [Allobranchiibius sp. CTAmp26]